MLEEQKLEELEDNSEGIFGEIVEEQEVEEASNIPSGVYQNNLAKASENKSSAISLLIVGLIGAVVVGLSWFEKLPFSIGGSRNLMSHSVLFVFFVIFIILGIVSACNVKKYKNLVSKEEDVKEMIRFYLKEAFTKEALEEMTEETDEEAYFNRMNFMRKELKEHFAEEGIDETLLESLLDEYYDTLFGNTYEN